MPSLCDSLTNAGSQASQQLAFEGWQQAHVTLPAAKIIPTVGDSSRATYNQMLRGGFVRAWRLLAA
jgi:hypothetical protein